jgi:hypothetical protein
MQLTHFNASAKAGVSRASSRRTTVRVQVRAGGDPRVGLGTVICSRAHRGSDL